MTKKETSQLCPICGKEMEYRIMYNFGDPNMGVSFEGWHCLEHGYPPRGAAKIMTGANWAAARVISQEAK